MIDIEIGGVIFQYPTKWSDINLSMFKRLNKIDNDWDDMDKNIEIVHILSGIDLDVLDSLSYVDFMKFLQHNTFLLNKEDKIRYEFTYDGVCYKMAKDLTKITSREFFDLDTLLKSEDSVDKLDIILAIMFRPAGPGNAPEPYNIMTVYDRAELFNEIFPCDLIISSLAFSTALSQASLSHFLDSLENQQSQI